MIPSYETFATSSFLLYLDNRICSRSGFYNVSSLAYPTNQRINGYNTYALPYSQIISDNSISGAIPFTGVYVNNSFIPVGTSGLSGINFDKGALFFDPNYAPNPINSISGSYSVKEINLSLADFPDLMVLFESKLGLRNKMPIQPTGLQNNQLTYPAAFVENGRAPSNRPWQIGGVDQTRSVFNVYFFGESLYQKNNFISLCKDMAWKYIPLIDNLADFPFNNLGYYKNNIPYNYQELTKNRILSGKAMLVESCEIQEFGKRGMLSEVQNMTTDSYFVMAEVTAWTSRVTS